MLVHRFLVSGPDESLNDFHLAVCHRLNAIERRGQTTLYTCLDCDREPALDAAARLHVTVQEWNGSEWAVLIQGPMAGWQPSPLPDDERLCQDCGEAPATLRFCEACWGARQDQTNYEAADQLAQEVNELREVIDDLVNTLEDAKGVILDTADEHDLPCPVDLVQRITEAIETTSRATRDGQTKSAHD